MAIKKRIRLKKSIQKNMVFLFWTTLFTSCLIFSCFQISSWMRDNHEIKKINEDLHDEIEVVQNVEEGDLVDENIEPSDYWYYIGIPFYEVSFQELSQKNSDTVAFIHMENTNINYPVVQSKDNDYYLHHAFDHSKNEAGWVFLDYRNSLTELDDNTIIYGHGRLDQTVFGSLKNVLTERWQQNRDNYFIWISTPTENMVFQIFSIYTIPKESYYISTHFSSNQEKQSWLDTMKGRNISPIDVPVSLENHILTLSTCQNNNGGRIVVQAKLIKKQAR